jgi:hypothetical protein
MQVNSSHISDVEWEGGVLTVSFAKGGQYRYYDVPEGIFRELVSAPSVGKFFAANVEGTFESEKVG